MKNCNVEGYEKMKGCTRHNWNCDECEHKPDKQIEYKCNASGKGFKSDPCAKADFNCDNCEYWGERKNTNCNWLKVGFVCLIIVSGWIIYNAVNSHKLDKPERVINESELIAHDKINRVKSTGDTTWIIDN